MNSTKGHLFPTDNSIKGKIKKLQAYLFKEFAFDRETFDYDKYWDRLEHENRPSTSLSKLKMIGELIELGSSVLDIGCGEGDILDYLRKTRNIEAHGIEFGGKAVEKAIARGIPVDVADITKQDFNITNKYDYIILSEVIEHLPKPEELLLKLKGKYNKYLIITIPNTGFIAERWRLMFGRFPKQWVLNPAEHLRFWTVPDFLFWCEQLDLKVEKYNGMKDDYYDLKVPLWRYYPKLFSRFILYKISGKTE
jgi:methionine biosynthesis protein MetW